MKNLFKVFAISALCLGFAQGSNAATETMRKVVSPTIDGAVIPGEFYDYWTFSLPSMSNISGEINNLSFDVPFVLNINNLQVSLYKAELGADVNSSSSYSSSVAVDNNAVDNAFSFANLASGDYAIKIYGDATGLAGGRYSGSFAISPVPEPEEWAMMMLGLGMMSFVACLTKSSGSISFQAVAA